MPRHPRDAHPSLTQLASWYSQIPRTRNSKWLPLQIGDSICPICVSERERLRKIMREREREEENETARARTRARDSVRNSAERKRYIEIDRMTVRPLTSST